jgi:quercetin dioxygenase-like cupin family protein
MGGQARSGRRHWDLATAGRIQLTPCGLVHEPALRIGRVQVWELDHLHVAAHHPQILRSDDDANRVIALLLPQGESLQEHQVHEHALVFVVRGELLVSAGASERTLSAPSLIHFDARERHEVRAISECQIVLCLAPWPGPGHPSRPDAA